MNKVDKEILSHAVFFTYYLEQEIKANKKVYVDEEIPAETYLLYFVKARKLSASGKDVSFLAKELDTDKWILLVRILMSAINSFVTDKLAESEVTK